MLKIGITGGIGSGKSTVSKVFEVLGIPVYYADIEAKKIMVENETVIRKIKECFGEQSYVDAALNRKYLSTIVFNNPAKLELLNSIVHPVTLQHAEEWMQRQGAPYCIKEAALIFESGLHEYLDKIIGVFAPVPLRIKRVMERDQFTAEEVKQRMNKQIDEDIKMRLCDYVIKNDEQELVIPQVMKIHEELLDMK
jgi:dephospho-CoA kinase